MRGQQPLLTMAVIMVWAMEIPCRSSVNLCAGTPSAILARSLRMAPSSCTVMHAEASSESSQPWLPRARQAAERVLRLHSPWILCGVNGLSNSSAAPSGSVAMIFVSGLRGLTISDQRCR